eukprot:1186415-Prorocentrum_minimum.AAC.2
MYPARVPCRPGGLRCSRQPRWAAGAWGKHRLLLQASVKRQLPLKRIAKHKAERRHIGPYFLSLSLSLSLMRTMIRLTFYALGIVYENQLCMKHVLSQHARRDAAYTVHKNSYS